VKGTPLNALEEAIFECGNGHEQQKHLSLLLPIVAVEKAGPWHLYLANWRHVALQVDPLALSLKKGLIMPGPASSPSAATTPELENLF
jgi:hypothetical protein